MNYYIQGSPTRAEQIKAAFQELGINVLDFGFADKTVVYCSIGECVQYLPYSINLMNILYSHPDYQELELTIKPKFKDGNWLYPNCNGIYPVLVTDYDKWCGYQLQELQEGSDGCHLSRKIVEDEYHLWSIADAKDGDVLCTYENDEPKIVFIYKNGTDVFMYYCFYNIMCPRFDANNEPGCLATKRDDVKPATKEQRDLLFAKMKESGYQWDADKKVLMKIKKINYKDMKQSEEYKMGYRDALTNIKNEIEQRIAETENVLEPLLTACNPIIGQRVASKQHNIKLGLAVAKIIIDKYYEDI